MMSIPGPWDKLETDTWEIFKIWVSLEWSGFWSKSLSQTSGHGLGQDMGTGPSVGQLAHCPQQVWEPVQTQNLVLDGFCPSLGDWRGLGSWT